MVNFIRTPSRLGILRRAVPLFALIAMLAVVVAPRLALAQSQSINGTIRGVVTDASGAVVGGAQITVKNLKTGYTSSQT